MVGQLLKALMPSRISGSASTLTPVKSTPRWPRTWEDLAGDGDHYAARVVSSAFAGKTRVQQHQMVYAALQGGMGTDLHALALQTAAPRTD